MSSKKNSVEKFFDKIYVISLFDKEKKWKKVHKQFKSRGVNNVERFIAVDGRCKNLSKSDILDKKRTFEISYNVEIDNPDGLKYTELLPASSLTISTVLLLRNQVRNNYEHVLLCEDDINLVPNFVNKFTEGIKEINKSKYKDNWDVLYLGCGSMCGNKGVSEQKTKENKYKSDQSDAEGFGDIYSFHPEDIRMPCYDCVDVSEHISVPSWMTGTWCYAYSLRGAKKMLKIIDNKVGEHIDKYLRDTCDFKGMNVLSFNPPIAMHEFGLQRPETTIPW